MVEAHERGLLPVPKRPFSLKPFIGICLGFFLLLLNFLGVEYYGRCYHVERRRNDCCLLF